MWHDGIYLSLWLTSLTMIISRSIYVVANDISFFLCLSLFFNGRIIALQNFVVFHHQQELAIGISFFFYGQYSIVCNYHIFFTCWWTFRLLPCLAIVNSAAMNIMMHVSFQIMFFCRYMPRSRIAGSYGNSIFSFLRNLPIALWASLIKKWRIDLQCRRPRFDSWVRKIRWRRG